MISGTPETSDIYLNSRSVSFCVYGDASSHIRHLREQSGIRVRLVPGILRHVARVMRRRWWRWWMMSRRMRMMMGVGWRVRMRMVLHLARPGGCRWAFVVLRRHLTSGARAARGVTATPATHAAEITRRWAARHGTSAP